MKVNDILKESNEIIEENKDVFDKIIKTDFFQTYFRPIMDQVYKNLEDHDEGYEDYLDLFIDNSYNDIDDVALYHGSKDRGYVGIYDFTYRKRPKDTDPNLHDYINKQAIDKFGEPIRNLLFIVRHEPDVATYGKPYIFIPMGKTIYYYHPTINDLTADYSSHDIIDLPRILEKLSQKTNIGEHYRPKFDVVLPILKYLRDKEVTKENLESIVTKEYNDLSEDDQKLLIDIIYTEIHRILSYYDFYIENVEETKNHLDAPKKAEIMVKTEEFALISLNILDNLIQYYLENYLRDNRNESK